MGRYINFVARNMRYDADATLPPPWVEPERWQDLAWVMAMMGNGNYPMEVGPMLSAWDKFFAERSDRAERRDGLTP